MKNHVLHGFKDNWVFAHAQVIIAAPDINLLRSHRSVSDGELGGDAVDIVEVAIALVLVLLLELGRIESLIIETRASSMGILDGGGIGGLGSMRASSGRRGRVALCAGELSRATGSFATGLSVGADTTAWNGIDSLLLVNSIDFGAASQASIASGAEGEGLAHDRAAAGLESKTGHRGGFGASYE